MTWNQLVLSKAETVDKPTVLHHFRIRSFYLLLALAACGCCMGEPAALYDVRVSVIDNHTKRPIQGATIEIPVTAYSGCHAPDLVLHSGADGKARREQLILNGDRPTKVRVICTGYVTMERSISGGFFRKFWSRKYSIVETFFMCPTDAPQTGRLKCATHS